MNTPNHLYVFSGVIVSLYVAWSIYRDIKVDVRRLLSGRNIVLCGIAAWFLLEAVLLSDEVRTYTQGTYDYSVFCVFLAAVSFLYGYQNTQGCRVFDPLITRFRWLDDPQMLWRVVLICGVIGFAPVLYYSKFQIFALIDGVLGMRKSWGGFLARGRYGGFREAMLMLEMFVKGAGPFAVILLLNKRVPLYQKAFCLIVAIWPLLRAYGSGTRSTMVTALMPALAVLFLRATPQTQRRIILGGLIAMPFAYIFMAAMVVSRQTGELSWESAKEAKYVGNEMFQELAYITTIVPDSLPYQWGYGYYVQIVNPIPRFLWEGKPRLDAGILMAQLKGEVDQKTGETFLTRSPGLIGEMYMNFGLVGIIGLSAFGGWIVRGWDNIALQNGNSVPTMILYFCGLGVLFILGRSFTMNMFYNIIFLLIGTYLVTGFFGRPKSLGQPGGELPRPSGGGQLAGQVRR